ncbi:hypothetical protein P700755_000208 [Psychroflexus torquis ATCC 700755]|uniref:Uncharacterized protein n=1 Tax=Psychroflexus torquis (strain ATCC 700755 / CIP 106069 / ACAM 623) TaxID=313595 RepID=K4I9E8_PSYTT|nr:hypothetical protein P700755_000208 [Psychroflexus torquis ATCC 700755]
MRGRNNIVGLWHKQDACASRGLKDGVIDLNNITNLLKDA